MRTLVFTIGTLLLTPLVLVGYRITKAVRMSYAVSLPMTFLGVVTTPRYIAATFLLTAAVYLLSR